MLARLYFVSARSRRSQRRRRRIWSFSSRRFEPVKAAAVGQWENDLIVGGLRLQIRDKRWRIRNRRPIGRA